MCSLRPARQTRGRSAASLTLPLVQNTREREVKDESVCRFGRSSHGLIQFLQFGF